MAKQDPLPKFPEKKVDDLIASFGREPSQKEVDRIKEIIQRERNRYRVLNRLRDRTKGCSRDADRGR